MKFTKIDYQNWERREIHEYFHDTSIYTTVHMDITDFLARVKEQGLRFYPTMIYCIAKVVNDHSDYRYGYDKDHNIGIWDRIHPLYTVPRKNAPHLFSMVVTKYQEDFDGFYNTFLADYERAEACGKLFCDGEPPANSMGITAMPGVHFSSFAFGDPGAKPDCTPFVVLGKYERQGERVILPVCGEFSHAVNDGYHITRFFEALATAIKDLNI